MRAPYQVLIIPYKRENDSYKFAIFKRADMDCYQWIAGGGEDFDLDILTTAKRECFEEAGLSDNSDYMQLDTTSPIPVHIFNDYPWGPDVLVIPEYSFGVHIGDQDIQLSHEHKSFEWVSYDQAMERLTYDSNKTALWELVVRLNRE